MIKQFNLIPIDGILIGTNTLVESELGNNGKEGVSPKAPTLLEPHY